MNNNYAIFNTVDPYWFSYYFPEIELTITTDNYDTNPAINKPAGNSEAQSAGRQLDATPTNIAKIELSAIEYGYLLSRNLTGTSCVVTINTGIFTLPCLAGIVGTIVFTGTNISIEIIPNTETLEISQNTLTIQSNCMYSLGYSNCTVNPMVQTSLVTVVNGNIITLATPVSIFDGKSWEAIIGTSSFIINVNASTANTLVVDRPILGRVYNLKVRRYCNRSYQNCRLYNNLAQFSGNPFLNTSSLNYNL